MAHDRASRPTVPRAGGGFRRGDHGALDFSHAYRAVVQEVADIRPLQGLEVDLFCELEVWETAGWEERFSVVDRLRDLARRLLEDIPRTP